MSNILRSSIPYRGPISENLIEFIHKGLEKNSKETIIIDALSGRSWKGKEIAASVRRVSRYLIDERGLKRGDTCAIYGRPDDQAVITILSVICAGGASVFLSDAHRPRELLDTAKATNCKFLITTKSLLDQGASTLSGLKDLIKVILYDFASGGYEGIASLLDKNSSYQGYSVDELLEKTKINNESDFAVIQFSSGTTGKPKPIPRTHKNLCHLVASVDHEELMDLKPGEVITGSLAVTHRPGLWALLACINGGSTFVLWSNLSDVEDALKTIEKYKVTIFSSSLPFLAMLGNVGIKIKDNYDLSSLKHVITSGAKIVHEDLPKSVVRGFNLKSLRQCFGMTECGWVFLIELSQAEDNYLSVGHVCPGMEAIIMDGENTTPLGAKVKKEIALRGPQIFPGYLTSEPGVFNRNDFTHDGWFRTGDQGYYDENRLVYIEGRYKELLVLSNNYRYFPNDIESIISEHPAIEGVCVVKAGEYRKEIVYDIARAFVTLKHGYNITEKEIIDFISERSSKVLLDGGVRVLEKFPRLENGKVNKSALKEMD